MTLKKKMQKLKKLCTLMMMLIILTTAFTSCQTTERAIEFPDFPNPVVDGISVVAYTEDTGLISMPLWYWLEITEYVIDIETIRSVQ